jgi:hypothetical protein
MEDRGWKIEDGGWRMEDGGLKHRRIDHVSRKDAKTRSKTRFV